MCFVDCIWLEFGFVVCVALVVFYVRVTYGGLGLADLCDVVCLIILVLFDMLLGWLEV